MQMASGRATGMPSCGRRQGPFGSGNVRRGVVALVAFLVLLGGAGVPALASGSLLSNYSFEEPRASDGSIPGWTPFANGPWMSLVREYATDGEWSLKVSDVSAKQSVGMRSAPVPVTAGAKYAVLADVYIEFGAAMLYLEFWDAQGKRIESALKTASASGTGRAVQLIVENTAPAEAVTVTVLLYCSVPNEGVAYFDNVYLESWD
ncbi:MAG: carbohydrate binding domain-containing protein [Limnochordales bacterium]|nr:carbohydrate binding domain-containing protein [Limnochordales bacterium]